jgi:hypothetical protein
MKSNNQKTGRKPIRARTSKEWMKVDEKNTTKIGRKPIRERTSNE